MRRIPALLCVAGLAAAPAIAAASPSTAPPSTAPSQTVETFEWSTSNGRLGMMVTSLTPELRTHFGAPADRGVLVARVAPGTPAAAAGIEVGDVIVGVRGQKIDDGPDVLAALADLGKGAHARLELVRDGKSRTVDATLAGDPVFQDRMTPFGEPSWFREWLKPFEQAKRGTDLPQTSEWLDKLRELFAPKTNQAQRS